MGLVTDNSRFIFKLGWHSGAVVTTVASSELGSRLQSFLFLMWNLHILYIFCRNTEFLPQKNTHMKLTGGLNSL